jgi:hypothetical protein
MKVGDKVWAHHPRGGYVTGFACRRQYGLYSYERGIAIDRESAKKNQAFTHVPVTQVHMGDPPQAKKEQP